MDAQLKKWLVFFYRDDKNNENIYFGLVRKWAIKSMLEKEVVVGRRGQVDERKMIVNRLEIQNL
jgi:hypothetical protein